MSTPVPSPARLADELAALGARLAAISAELRALQQQVPVPAPVWYGPPPVPPAAPAPPPPPAPRRPGLLEREGAGSRLLGWLGGAVTLLGVLLLLVLAVQRGWLGPGPRVLGGAVLALALVAVAVRVHRTPGGRVGAVTLAATGFAALYLDVIAATTFYGYLSVAGGLVVAVVVACGALSLAHRWRAQALAVAAVVGAAVLAPVLTELDAVPLVGFLLVLQVVAVPVQLRHRWTALSVVAAVPPLLAGLVLAGVVAVDEPTLRDALAIGAVTLVGLGVAALGSWCQHRIGVLDGAAPAVLAASPVPVLLLAPSLPPTAGVTVAVVLAAVLLAAWAGIRLGGAVLPRPFGALCGGLGALAAFEATVLAVDGSVLAAVLLGETVALAVAAERIRSRGVLGAATAFGSAGSIVALVDVLAPPTLVAYTPRGVGALVAAAGLGVLLAAVALTSSWAVGRLALLRDRTSRTVLWLLGGLGALYGAAGSTLALALLALPDRSGFLTGHVVVTVSWTLAALVLLARGLTSLPVRTAGMCLVGAAVAKLVLFDLAALDGVARVAAFLGAGLVLLAAGARYARLVAQAEQVNRAVTPAGRSR